MTIIDLADKARHVRAATQDRDHTCHWPGCGKQVPPAKWGCASHWFRLPLRIRNRIWAAYQPGQERYVSKDNVGAPRPSDEYMAAARAAQDWIAHLEASQPLPPAA